jgi:hypothetical protein
MSSVQAQAATGFDSEPPARILSSAIESTTAASSYTITGIDHQGGTTYRFHYQVDQAGLVGTVSYSYSTGTVSIIETGGTIYFRANRAFWMHVVIPEQVSLLSGHWLSSPSGSTLARVVTGPSGFDKFAALQGQLRSLRGTHVAVKGSAIVDGQPVVVLRAQPGSGSTGTVDVIQRPPHYIVQLAEGRDEIRIADLGASIEIHAPPSAIPLDTPRV